MKLKKFLHLISIVFVVWSNSSFAPVGTNAGFFCNDTTIGEPYHGDSVSLSMLLLSLLGGPSFIIYVSELLLKGQSSGDADHLKNPFKWHVNNYHSGLLLVMTVTEILKLTCGELRPHFLTTCQPDMEHIKCSDGFVRNFTCTGSGPDWLVKRDIYKSFPSGHASLSFYTFIFLSIYVYSRSKNVTQMSLRCWRMSIFIVPLVWSIVCCISRLLDHRHFWWDVLFGIFIGFIGGSLMGKWSVSNSGQQKVRGS